ncbi:MAG TPA: dihydropteroate synthase [Phycisphaerales bacterium]|nr:dihydropteroate synthase [Phycisphaerales bacterium]
MGILNVTPDSFSDGGRFLEPAAAVAQAREMLASGAEILDIGAESTRPGSRRVPPDEQIARLREILPAVVSLGARVSIDTTRAKVAAFALDAGAAIVNDISAGRDDPELFPLVAERACPLVLMHMLGEPATMQSAPRYGDVVAEVEAFLSERLAAAVACGVSAEKVILDPGIGFGKTLEHNLALLAGLGELAALGRPVLVGPSRKRFLGELTGRTDPAQRISATVAACLEARKRGATIFRVHDVAALADALAVAQAVEGADPGKKTSL